jgi:hypothetical protein
VVTLFGGARQLTRALKEAGYPKHQACVYKWLYPYPKGTGGLIPDSALKAVKLAAKREGIILTKADLEKTPLIPMADPSTTSMPASNAMTKIMRKKGYWK